MVDRYKAEVSNVQATAHMAAHPAGDYVRATDYDALAARVDELEARLAASLEQHAAVERLYAELHSQWKPIIDAQLRAATPPADGAVK